MVADMHACSYQCDNPPCIKRQRDELLARIDALTADAECLRIAREQLPTKVESAGPWGGMTLDEVAAFDSGYNAALNRAHLLLMASLAPANECPDDGCGHLSGAGDAALAARQQEPPACGSFDPNARCGK